MDKKKYKRSEVYRDRYFRTHPGKHGKYRCGYCGKRFPAAEITIDHILPISAVKKRKYRKKLPYGVNDMDNLVPACQKCNLHKGRSVEKRWQRQAKRGRKEGYWIARKIPAIILLIIIGLLVYRYAYGGMPLLEEDLFNIKESLTHAVHMIENIAMQRV